MTDQGADEKVALEQVIRSFSDAEVALQEIAAEAQRIRSASQQLGAAHGALESSSGALAASAEALTALAGRLESSASSLRTTAERLAALDPQRVFAQLGALHQDIESMGKSVTETINGSAAEAKEDRVRIATEGDVRTRGLAERLETLDRRVGRQGLLTVLVLVVGVIATIVSLYGVLVR